MNSHEYNLPNEKGRDKFQWYEGRPTEQMPALLADGRVPMNMSQIMQRRLDVRNFSYEVESSWRDNYFDTGDAVVYHPDNERFKVVLDSEDLRRMTPDTPRNGGALKLTRDDYESLEGEEFKKDKIGQVNELMSREDVKAHPVWKVLARDKALLNDYADYVFTEGEKVFGNGNAMGVFLGSAYGDCPEMRAWCVDRLVWGSDAYGGDDLDGICGGRFAGIAPEALSAGGEGTSGQLEAGVKNALDSGKSFEYDGIIYVPAAKGSGLKL